MGTAVAGNGRIYLVAEFNHMQKLPHFEPSYETDLKNHPRSYALKKGEFHDMLNSNPETKNVIRSDTYTIKKTINAYQSSAGKPSGLSLY
jgi:hypothetical protein